MTQVLLIDDEPMVLKTVRAFLERAGCEVSEAINGRIGVELFHTRKFDLVITDILMPDLDGMEAVRILRETDQTVKILAMSGGGRTGNQEFLVRARELGADETVKKPFTRVEFMAKVEALLRERRLDPDRAFG